MAHAYIDAVAETGADAVKFQMHIASEESSELEPWRVKFSQQDATRFDYWRRMEFSPEQWLGLKAHAEEKGLVFLCSAFSLKAVEQLEAMGMAGWKVASGEVTNRLLLDAMVDTKKPILLSSGMSSVAELDEAVSVVREAGCPVAVFQCTTAYPCPPEKVGLNQVTDFLGRYSCPVGLSDHSGTIYPSLAAVTLGARLIEVHVAFHRGLFGPDVKASLTVEELKEMVEGVRFTEAMQANPVLKDEAVSGMEPLRQMFGQSLVATVDMSAGTVIGREHLSCRKPGHGIRAGEYRSLIGRTINRDLRAGEFLALTDL